MKQAYDWNPPKADIVEYIVEVKRSHDPDVWRTLHQDVDRRIVIGLTLLSLRREKARIVSIRMRVKDTRGKVTTTRSVPPEFNLSQLSIS